MKQKWVLAMAGLMWAAGAAGPAAAQNEAYRCGPNTYSQQPCGTAVNTMEHAAPASTRGAKVAARRLPGESDAEFELRSRRTGLSQTDQDECRRLDTKIPFEQTRLKKAVSPDETTQAQESLDAARKRFGQLHC